MREVKAVCFAWWRTAGCSYRFVYARHEYFDLCAYNEKNASKHLALRASLLACIDIGL